MVAVIVLAEFLFVKVAVGTDFIPVGRVPYFKILWPKSTLSPVIEEIKIYHVHQNSKENKSGQW